jgi:hypothetical protein
MDRQEEQIAHELNRTTPANFRKTAPQGPFTLKLTNSHPTTF